MFTPALRQRSLSPTKAQPLITYYDGVADTRTELSAVTFANWVDKTANLIADLGHEDGEPIDIAVASTHPGHWMSLVWIAAAWQRGCPVLSDAAGSDLLVVGPGDARRGATTVACSLHPLGMGFAETPADAIDYAEVLAQPDIHDASSWSAQDIFDDRPLQAIQGRDSRLLLPDPRPGIEDVVRALVSPVLGSGSTVVAVGCTAELLVSVATAEHASLPS